MIAGIIITKLFPECQGFWNDQVSVRTKYTGLMGSLATYLLPCLTCHQHQDSALGPFSQTP